MDPQRRSFTTACLGATAAVLLAEASAQAVPFDATPSADSAMGEAPVSDHDGRHDFDFFHGRWRLHNRRLKDWLVGSGEWIEFGGALDCRPVLGDIGNLDELTADYGEGIHGLSLRLYDPATRRWSDYWASRRDGLLNPPVVGGFVDGVGTFFGEDRFEGRPVRVRATWTRRGVDEVEWRQAFSIDRGRTWETNWTMRMIRQA